MSLKKKILRALGLNETRLRWKVERFKERLQNRDDDGGDDKPRDARRTTKHCPSCRALVSADERVCPSCEAPLPSMTSVRIGRAVRSLLPDENPTTKLMLVVIFGMFALVTLDGARDGGLFGALMHPPMEAMYRWGAHVRGYFEPWRLIVSNFLHFGIIHLVFNCYALHLAGPEVERMYGSGLALAMFVVTGTGAMAISNLIGGVGIVAGASGALMGFIGLAAAGGHRDGTSYGRAVRTQMLRWAAFVMFIGFAAAVTNFMAIDNIAHGAGFVLGGALGMVLPMRTIRRRQSTLEHRAVVVAVVLSIATLGFGFYGMVDAKRSSDTFADRFQACVDQLAAEQWKAAIEPCSEAVDINPDAPEAYNNLALAHLRAGQGNEAAAVCDAGFARLGSERLLSGAPVCAMLGR